MMYRVAEFAKLAGVTVRTLQYYDRIGLLHPDEVTEAGHRLYAPHDLIRLQQIVTLKWMGFALAAIQVILDNPAYDLRQSLAIQQAAIEEKIAHLREASAMLGRALAQADDPDTDSLTAIIRAVNDSDHASWAKDYYSEAAWRGIQTRRFAYSPEQLAQSQQDWQDLHEAFAQHQHEPPESEAVQALAARMQKLIDMFTGGDAETEAGLTRFNMDAAAGRLPPGYEGPTAAEFGDPDVRAFMQRALMIYRERRQS